jgi:hypothetical protein
MVQEWLIVIGIMLVPTTAALTGLWLGALRRARRAEAIVQQIALSRAQGGTEATQGDAVLRSALDSMALDVERIAEGQRYVAKLLSERSSHLAASEPPRPITPH